MIYYGESYKDVIEDGKELITDVNPMGYIYYANVKSFLGIKYISGKIESVPWDDIQTLRLIHAIRNNKVNDAIEIIDVLYTRHKSLVPLKKYSAAVINPTLRHVVDMMLREEPINNIKLYMSGIDINDVELYKVLGSENQSIHGGKYQWELDVYTAPIRQYNIKMCRAGYHLTNNPIAWANQHCRVYKARGNNLVDVDGDKFVYSSAVIYEELPYAYLFYFAHKINRYNSAAKVINEIESMWGITPSEYSISGMSHMLSKHDIGDTCKTIFNALILMNRR